MNLWTKGLGALLLTGICSAPLLAGDKDLLDRLEPVPANEVIPVRDFFRPRLFNHPELNPAGTHFAAIVSTGDDRLDLMTYELSTNKLERLTAGGVHDIANYDWLNDSRLLFSLIKDKIYSAGLFAVELGRFSKSYELQRNLAMQTIGFPTADPTHAIVWIRQNEYDEKSRGDIMKINTQRMAGDGRSVLSAGGWGLHADVVKTYPNPLGGYPTGYLSDRSGELAYALTQQEGIVTVHRWVDGRWERCPINLDVIQLVGVGDRPGELLVLGPRQAGKPRGLHRLDATTGALGELILQDDRYDFRQARLYRHPVDHRLLGAQYDRKGPQSVWFEPRYGEIQDALNRAFPNDMVRILGSDRKETQFFVAVFSDVRPTTYHHLNLSTNSAKLVADVVPWIDPKRMQPMRLITYKSRDGFDIEGYVTLPAGVSEKNKAPLVVLPHGGPWVRDTWAWNPETQFLASRGYAVFQPNYRGSSGTAWRFPEEDMWAFRKMHDDVTDGVKTVLRSGLIDPDRVAIMGGSFGGYLALSGAVHEPDLYRCAITISGVFDWERVMKDSRRSMYARGHYGVLRRELGDPKAHQEKFEALSPIHHVNQIKIPIFVAHGKEDVVASVGQSNDLVKQLEKFGVVYEKQIEAGEGHGFRQLDHQVKLYSAIESFLAKHLAPRAPAPLAAGTPLAAATP